MQIKSEQDILKPEIRKQIIEDIKSPENQARKYEAYKRYLCYKDQTDAFVKEQLQAQFDSATVEEMSYCIANISLVRKIIDKLARVYSAGVTRELEGEDSSQTQVLNDIAKELDFNSEIKKTNKFLKLQKNVAFYIKPCPIDQNGQPEKYTLRLEPLNPYLYDAIEYEYDRRRPMAYILSDFEFKKSEYVNGDAAYANRKAFVTAKNLPQGNGKDETIADSPDDAESKVFIWWSDNYHFTTDAKGKILSEQIENPIKIKPFVNFAIDQDGQFWARGGDDLVKGAILVNAVMTNNQHIATSQGYGQFWMRGKNPPTQLKVGPTKSILMTYEEGEPVPELGFASANPQLDSLRSLVESYIALLLTTNNLSTSAVASQLGQNNLAPSGIAMMIDKAESREDIDDQRQIFIDNEPMIWDIVRRWLDVYKNNLVEGLSGKTIPEKFNLKIKFHDAPVVVSEAEKLANLKLRKELGLDRMVDLIMKDNPDLSLEEAEERLKLLLEDKITHEMGQQDQQGQQDNQNQDQNSSDLKDVTPGNEVDQSN